MYCIEFLCTYIGNFDKDHNKYTKKHWLIGPAKENSLMSINDDWISCEAFREREANRLIKIGKFSIIYNPQKLHRYIDSKIKK